MGEIVMKESPSYLFVIIIIITVVLFREIAIRKIKKSWITVEGIVVTSSAKDANYDTFDSVKYQFYYKDVLYENQEEIGYEDTPSLNAKVTVYINPKNIYKSTIKPRNIIIKIVNAIFALLFFGVLLLYRVITKG